MEVQTKQASLPKLKISGERLTEESNRRDSLSSSRTGDSGYNSDPDISLSPLDFVTQDSKDPALAYFQYPLPSLTFEYVEFVSPTCAKTARVPKGAYGSILNKRYGEGQRVANINKLEVTSNPSFSLAVQGASKPDWTNAFKNPSEALSNRDQVEASREDEVALWIDESIPSHNRPKERVSSIVSLSSAGSAEMYSVTEDDEEDEAPEPGPSILSKVTLETIELIMRKIEVNLGYAAYMQCAGGGQTSRNYSSTVDSSRTTGRASGQGGAGGKRKSRTDENTHFDPPDDDGSTKRRRVSITTTEDSETGPRFACPFFKHDPNRYRNRRTCPGPGWPTVHRMKEHLYRAHEQPIFCPRCYTMFDSSNEFSVHLRGNPCQISLPQPIDGIGRETLMGLRKRSPALRLEEDKWRDTYRLLFPGVEGADIPSPYYDNNSPSEESRRFRRDLLQRIRCELFATAEQEPGSVEQNLLRQVADIIQRCETDLLSSIQPAPLPPLAETAPRQPTPAFHHPTNSRSGAAQTPSQSHALPASAPRGQDVDIPMSAPSQFFTEPPPPAQYAPVVWEDNPQTPSSEWIDWNVVFPPGLESQVERPALATPVWT